MKLKLLKQSGKGNAPLWLSTLSAISVLSVLITLVIMIKSDWKILIFFPVGMFSGIILSGIQTMIKYKSITITPNDIKKLK